MTRSVITLFLLPYAGGAGASFKAFIEGLPGWIRPVPVTLPGRGGRFHEPAMTNWPALVDRLAGELIDDARRPYALFGHSLGALVAFELAHRFQSLGAPAPVWLGVSACVAPSRRRPGEDWLDCDDGVLLEKLRRLDGTPTQLFEHRDLLDIYLPVLRADFHLASSYAAPRREPLRSRMLILAGRDDDEVTVPPENIESWARETRGVSRVHIEPGGHFFLNENATAIARICAEDVGSALMFDEVMHD